MKLTFFDSRLKQSDADFEASESITKVICNSTKFATFFVCQSLENLSAAVINVAGACFFKQCNLADAKDSGCEFITAALFSTLIFSTLACQTADKIFLLLFNKELNSHQAFNESSWFNCSVGKIHTYLVEKDVNQKLKYLSSTLLALPLTAVLLVDIISSPFIDLGKACLELGGKIIRPSKHSFFEVKTLIVSAVARGFLVPFNLASLPIVLVSIPFIMPDENLNDN